MPPRHLVRARPGRTAATEVADIRPTAAEVPCNLLRLYVWFSAPMSEGYAAGNVRLAGDGGPRSPEPCCPASMSCGTPPVAGSPSCWTPPASSAAWLATGRPVTRCDLASHSGWSSTAGSVMRKDSPCEADAQRRYEVGGEERRHVDPASWLLTVPPAGTSEPVQVAFGRPLDHGLLARCLHVAGPGGELTPRHRCRSAPGNSMAAGAPPGLGTGSRQLIVDPVLEDLAGNSVSRVFDRDLTRPKDEPRQARPVTVPFRPR